MVGDRYASGQAAGDVREGVPGPREGSPIRRRLLSAA